MTITRYTFEMIEAGAVALAGIREEDWPFTDTRQLAVEVFEAMLPLLPLQPLLRELDRRGNRQALIDQAMRNMRDAGWAIEAIDESGFGLQWFGIRAICAEFSRLVDLTQSKV